MSIANIVTEALSLSPEARAFVAERLLESIDAAPGSDLSPAWRDEIPKRCQEMDGGAVELRHPDYWKARRSEQSTSQLHHIILVIGTHLSGAQL